MNPDELDDLELREEAQKRKLRRENELIDVQQVMMTKCGRALIWRQLSRLNVYGNPFVAGMPDVTAFQCGERNAGLWLLQEVMEACPDLYAKMQEEQNVQEL